VLRRENIRYGAWWVRVVCCLAVAIAVANAVYFRMLASIEGALEGLLSGGGAPLAHASKRAEIAIVFALSLAAAVPRIERPLSMVGFGAGFVLAYAAAAWIAAAAGTALPLASAVLAVLGSTAFLETMAWSEERSRRRTLERLEVAREQLTDMLVHDLRKRLSSILMSFSMVEKTSQPGRPPDAELFATIRSSAERMRLMIDDLLDIRKIEEGRMALQCEPLPLRVLVDDQIREHRSAAALLDVSVGVSGDGATVRVDRRIFSRIFANLFWNALQHAPAGTVIEIAVAGADGEASLSIANRGPSIPKARQALLFRAFVAGRSPPPALPTDGAGLGLSFCKLAVEAHGGAIRLDSPWPGHDDGVRVQIRFPAASPSQPRTAA